MGVLNIEQLRVAVIHEWLTDWGGSEAVTAAMLEMLPQARLHALFDFLTEESRSRLDCRPVRTTFLQNLPGMRKRFWYWLWLMPLAVERMDTRGFDLVISSSHAFAKGVLTSAEQCHISYVHSPMRYAWDLYHDYLNDYRLTSGFRGFMANCMFHSLRQWDRNTANGVDIFVANSNFVARRIWKTYRRKAIVIHPPVNVSRICLREDKEDFYLVVSRLVSYKRVDLIVEAFAAMPQRKLVIIGEGPELPKLKARATANISFLGYQTDAVVMDYLQRARAFVFAAVEDFGITPVEAQAAGTPVVALARGGALETVVGLENARPPTGVFFQEQTVAALRTALEQFEAVRNDLDAKACRSHAETFSSTQFRSKFSLLVSEFYPAWRDGRAYRFEEDQEPPCKA